ncbi:cyanoexosortase B system-associated protein [Baaleninema sp.]|uniref:cyanoexosortase B system-associated protein n=1 Tax=Baaleninema sp. TaxID=3101197 RepID=UPI003D047075
MEKSAPFPKFLRRSSPFALAAIVLFLLLLLAVAIPNYIRGQLPFREAQPAELSGLQKLNDTGLELSGWTTVDLRTVNLGSGAWVMQTLMWDDPASLPYDPGQATVLLHPQKGHSGTRSQPQMEWTDIRGLGNAQGEWKEDNQRQFQFDATADDGTEATVTVRFFRGWTAQKTYAIAQWYAWETGGHPSLTRWFQADRRARLDGRREPWVAVCVMTPIEPLGDIKNARPLIESLASRVQKALMDKAFVEPSRTLSPSTGNQRS